MAGRALTESLYIYISIGRTREGKTQHTENIQTKRLLVHRVGGDGRPKTIGKGERMMHGSCEAVVWPARQTMQAHRNGRSARTHRETSMDGTKGGAGGRGEVSMRENAQPEDPREKAQATVTHE